MSKKGEIKITVEVDGKKVDMVIPDGVEINQNNLESINASGGFGRFFKAIKMSAEGHHLSAFVEFEKAKKDFKHGYIF